MSRAPLPAAASVRSPARAAERQGPRHARLRFTRDALLSSPPPLPRSSPPSLPPHLFFPTSSSPPFSSSPVLTPPPLPLSCSTFLLSPLPPLLSASTLLLPTGGSTHREGSTGAQHARLALQLQGAPAASYGRQHAQGGGECFRLPIGSSTSRGVSAIAFHCSCREHRLSWPCPSPSCTSPSSRCGVVRCGACGICPVLCGAAVLDLPFPFLHLSVIQVRCSVVQFGAVLCGAVLPIIISMPHCLSADIAMTTTPHLVFPTSFHIGMAQAVYVRIVYLSRACACHVPVMCLSHAYHVPIMATHHVLLPLIPPPAYPRSTMYSLPLPLSPASLPTLSTGCLWVACGMQVEQGRHTMCSFPSSLHLHARGCSSALELPTTTDESWPDNGPPALLSPSSPSARSASCAAPPPTPSSPPRIHPTLPPSLPPLPFSPLSWRHYYLWRGLPLHSPAALLLHTPLTILLALHLLLPSTAQVPGHTPSDADVPSGADVASRIAAGREERGGADESACAEGQQQCWRRGLTSRPSLYIHVIGAHPSVRVRPLSTTFGHSPPHQPLTILLALHLLLPSTAQVPGHTPSDADVPSGADVASRIAAGREERGGADESACAEGQQQCWRRGLTSRPSLYIHVIGAHPSVRVRPLSTTFGHSPPHQPLTILLALHLLLPSTAQVPGHTPSDADVPSGADVASRIAAGREERGGADESACAEGQQQCWRRGLTSRPSLYIHVIATYAKQSSIFLASLLLHSVCCRLFTQLPLAFLPPPEPPSPPTYYTLHAGMQLTTPSLSPCLSSSLSPSTAPARVGREDLEGAWHASHHTLYLPLTTHSLSPRPAPAGADREAQEAAALAELRVLLPGVDTCVHLIGPNIPAHM
ncbi:unnamed protein product [Closterium sp. NIES-64]|nr:unnamed protein product [Closterium sp. NIES-64]